MTYIPRIKLDNGKNYLGIEMISYQNKNYLVLTEENEEIDKEFVFAEYKEDEKMTLVNDEDLIKKLNSIFSSK